MADILAPYVLSLAHFDAALEDTSGRDYVSTGGAALSATQKKFGAQSVLVSGSTSYLTSEDSGFRYGASDSAAVEAWVYLEGHPSANATLLSLGGTLVAVSISSAGRLVSTAGTGATTVTPNAWHHLAVSKSGGSTRVYLDGVQELSVADVAAGSDYRLIIGNTTANGYTGYFDEVRVTIGATRYNAAFPLPTAAFTTELPTDDLRGSVLLHLDFNSSTNGSAIAPTNTASSATITNTNVTLDFAAKRFGTAGANFSGANRYYSVSATQTLNFGTGDFTIETQWYHRFNANTNGTIWSSGHSWVAGAAGLHVTNTGIRFNTFSYGALLVYNEVWTETYRHVAVTRQYNTLRLFIDGVEKASATFTGSLDFGTTSFRIGRNSYDTTENGNLYGYLDDFRISGRCRYTGNFTPPDTALATDGNVLVSYVSETIPAMVPEIKNKCGVTLLSDSNMGYSAAGKFSTGVGIDGDDYYYVNGEHRLYNLCRSGYGGSVECWFAVTDIATSRPIFSLAFAYGSTTEALSVYVNTSGYLCLNVRGVSYTTTTEVTLGDFHHVALTVPSTADNVALFFNGDFVFGVDLATINSSTNTTFLLGTGLASSGTTMFNFHGVISDVRVTAGTERSYNPSINRYAVLVEDQDGLLTVDRMPPRAGSTGNTTSYLYTQHPNGVLSPSTAISTAESKYGASSLLCAGEGARFTSGTSTTIPTAFNGAAGNNVTLHAWVHPTTLSGNHPVVQMGYSGYCLGLYVKADGTVSFGMRNGSASGSTVTLTSSAAGAVVIDEWTHVAGVAHNSVLYLYVNGELVGTPTSFTTMGGSSNGTLAIGEGYPPVAGVYSAQGFIGYIDGAEVWSNARYTTGFEVPSQLLTTQYNIGYPVSTRELSYSETEPTTATITATIPLTLVSIGDQSARIAASLPKVRMNMYSSSPCSVAASIPSIGTSIRAHAGAIGTIAASIPSISAWMEEKSGAMKITLPSVQTAFSAGGGRLAQIDASTKRVTTRFAARLTVLATIDAQLPSTTAQVDAYRGTVATLETSVPEVIASASAMVGASGVIEISLPPITMRSDTSVTNIATMAVTLKKPYTEIFAPGAAVTFLTALRVVPAKSIVTTYSAFPMTSMAINGNRLLGAADDGLYELDTGATDGTAPIECEIATGEMDFGSTETKRIGTCYVAGEFDALTVTVSADGGDSSTYPLQGAVGAVKQHRAVFGRGRSGKYWTLSIKNIDGGEMTVSNIELDTELSPRRISR